MNPLSATSWTSWALTVLMMGLLPGCGRKPGSARDFKLPYGSWAAAPSEGPRAAEPCFKGVELYSWRTSDGAWRFSLLLGTNDFKGVELVTAQEYAIVGVAELKERLARLAEGERVCWWRDAGPLQPGQRNPLSLPPREVLDELVAYCRGLGISLTIAKTFSEWKPLPAP